MHAAVSVLCDGTTTDLNSSVAVSPPSKRHATAIPLRETTKLRALASMLSQRGGFEDGDAMLCQRFRVVFLGVGVDALHAAFRRLARLHHFIDDLHAAVYGYQTYRKL